MGHGTLVVLASLALAGLAASAQETPPATSGSGQSPWNTGTAPPRLKPPAEDSTLALRLYDEGLSEGKLPYRSGPRRRDDPAWAVDVSAVMTRCPDGNRVITALVIGGQLTPLDNRCPDEQQPGQSAKPAATPALATPQCDAKTWNCATKPAASTPTN